MINGLDQLLESLAHADQLDSLDVEGILALRSISQRCSGRIKDAARILEAQNETLCAEERAASEAPVICAMQTDRGIAELHPTVRFDAPCVF